MEKNMETTMGFRISGGKEGMGRKLENTTGFIVGYIGLL